MTKLVFHLGDMKTGSTAIQTVLMSKSWACDSVKLHYPSGGRASHIILASCLQSNPPGVRLDSEMNAILDELAHASADVAVISAEQFEKVDPKVLLAAIETYMPNMVADARFIAYVRPHADRIPSGYAERVKIGNFLGTMTEFEAAQYQRETVMYTPRFQAWRDTFEDAFELRPMIREQLYRQDVVADFLQFALQTDDFTIAEVPDTNESLSLENLSILRHLQTRIAAGHRRTQTYQGILGRSLSRQMNKSAFRDGTKIRLHKDLAKLIRVQYASDAAALDAAFFKGTPMTDALDASVSKAVDTEQMVRIEDHFTPREQFLISTLIDQSVALVHSNPDQLLSKLRRYFGEKSEDDDDALPSDLGKVKPLRARSGSGLLGKKKPGKRGLGKAKAVGARKRKSAMPDTAGSVDPQSGGQ